MQLAQPHSIRTCFTILQQNAIEGTFVGDGTLALATEFGRQRLSVDLGDGFLMRVTEYGFPRNTHLGGGIFT